MKREYAQEPPVLSVVRLNPLQCEILLCENITAETRKNAMAGTDEGPITVYSASEYTIVVPWREGLEEDVKANIVDWLALARKQEFEALLPKKLLELSEACRATILAGCTVTLSDGAAEHFSLEETDQINLNAAFAAVERGAPAYPYHADGQLCRMYPAADIISITTAATVHKLYHTTYCNHAMTWARRATNADELSEIYYGAGLPEDLAANMEQVIKNASDN